MTKTLKKLIAFLLIICGLTVSMLSCSFWGEKAEELFVGKLSDQATWLKEASSENVVRVGVLRLINGIHPSTLMDCYYSTTESEIVAFIEFYKNLEVEEVSSDKIEAVIGGGGINIEFTYADGSSKTIHKTQGYFIIGSQAFKPKASDDFDYKTTFDRYSRMGYDKPSNVFTNTEEPELVGETDDISDFRFKAIEAEEDAYLNATHYIEVEFGKIYILSETQFCINKIKAIDYYELMEGQSFRDFITVKTEAEQ